MGAPAAFVAGRFAWVSYRDRLGIVPARLRKGAGDDGPPSELHHPAVEVVPDVHRRDAEQVETASAPEPVVGEGHPAAPGASGEADDRLVGSRG